MTYGGAATARAVDIWREEEEEEDDDDDGGEQERIVWSMRRPRLRPRPGWLGGWLCLLWLHAAWIGAMSCIASFVPIAQIAIEMEGSVREARGSP